MVSLTFAMGLLALVVITTPVFARERDPHWELPFGITAFVLLLASGPEPLQTYVRLAAGGVGVLLLAVAWRGATAEAISTFRRELHLSIALGILLLVSTLIAPDTKAVQYPLLAATVGVGVALIIGGCTKATGLLWRAARQKP